VVRCNSETRDWHVVAVVSGYRYEAVAVLGDRARSHEHRDRLGYDIAHAIEAIDLLQAKSEQIAIESPRPAELGSCVAKPDGLGISLMPAMLRRLLMPWSRWLDAPGSQVAAPPADGRAAVALEARPRSAQSKPGS